MDTIEDSKKIVYAIERLDLGIEDHHVVAAAISKICPYWVDTLQNVGMKGAAGYRLAVEKVMSTHKGWIRAAAKKYLAATSAEIVENDSEAK